MWVSPDDGLPRRINIEAFTAVDPAKGLLNVTRATLKFSHFGEDIGIHDLLLY
jgi:hypothetical protein